MLILTFNHILLIELKLLFYHFFFKSKRYAF